MSPNFPSRRRHQVMVVGLVAGVIALGVPWITVRLTTGAEGGATWADFSAASFSLGLAAAAAWGATLLTGRLGTRVFAVIQTALAVAALIGIAVAVREVDDVAVSLAGEITGVSGVFGANDIVVTWNQWAVGLAIVTNGAFFLSGVLGIAQPGVRRGPSRYEQSREGESAHPWDQLSDGADPTAR